MRFGLWAPLPHTIQAEPRMETAIKALLSSDLPAGDTDPAFSFVRDAVKRAESLNFSTVLFAERLLGPDPEAWMLAAALAAETRSIELLVAVHPGIVPPQMAAKMAATLDRISGGRAALNLISGWWPEEMDIFGNGAWLGNSDDRAERLGEFADVFRGLSSSSSAKPFSYEGRYFQCRDAHMPIRTLQTPCAPLYAAGRSPLSRRIIAEKCDVWFAEYETDFRVFDANLAKVRSDIAEMQTLAQEAGNRLEFGLSAHVICAPSTAAAEGAARELEEYGKRDRVALTSAKALGAGLVGTPSLIASRLQAYEDAGVSHFLLRFHPMMDGLETFAAEVMPLLARTAT